MNYWNQKPPYQNNNIRGLTRSENYRPSDSKKNFFFSNTYDNPEDARWMQLKVKKDLEPFRDYINKSIENLKSLKDISAECREVKPRTILFPKCKVIRVKEMQALRIKLPEEKYYCFFWDTDEYGYFDTFSELLFKRDVILESNKHIAYYNDHVIFAYDGELDTSKKFALYDNEGNMHNCTISKLDFTDLETCSAESGNAIFESAFADRDGIIYKYTGKAGKTITLFGKLSFPAIITKNVRIGFSKMLNQSNVDTEVYDESDGILVINNESALSTLTANGLEYDELSNEDIYKLIIKGGDNPSVVFKNEMIECPAALGKHKFAVLKNGILTESNESNGGIVFEIRTDATQRASSKSNILLDLIEDENSISDLNSNTSYFFLETVEEVKDERGFKYKIEKKYENFSQIEIKKHGGHVPQRLSIVPNERQLKLQLSALETIINTPNRFHAPILELMQDRERANWREVDYNKFKDLNYYILKNEKYEGCKSQREFVKKALATPDFAFLEGPPGSGKTTTILELIAQMVERGQKVILAASTNAAIDNILERLDSLPAEIKNKILAVRLGNESAISKSVENYTIFDISNEDMANAIISRANLVCGTIIGILRHPNFKIDKTPAVPLYDCLIIDEASKTTFQEFLVPAVYSKKWILSGDIKQLTPYIDKDNIAAALERISDFDKHAQNAHTILMHLKNDFYDRNKNLKNEHKPRFLIQAPTELIKHVEKLSQDYSDLRIASISNRAASTLTVSKNDYLQGKPKAALVWGADVLFCDTAIYDEIKSTFPKDFIPLMSKEADIVNYKSVAHLAARNNFQVANKSCAPKDIGAKLTDLIKEKSWSSEIAWRLVRIQELFMLSEIEGEKDRTIAKYNSEILKRIPSAFRESAMKDIQLLREIALPSIVQLLQQGLSDEIKGSTKITTLNSGFKTNHLNSRRVLVEYQHRMHSDISAFSAKNIYNNTALKNGTVIDRSWCYDGYPESRAVWVNVKARDNLKARDNRSANFNVEEKDEIVRRVKDFLKFAEKNKKDNGESWTIACLSYYKKQESILKNAIKDIAKASRPSSYYKLPEYNAEIMIYTVDKFQGKEADIVFLSMVKKWKNNLGFMDSPNRLNVAITRAKYQMVVVGDAEYFKKQNQSKLLQTFAMEYNK